MKKKSCLNEESRMNKYVYEWWGDGGEGGGNLLRMLEFFAVEKWSEEC